MNHKPFPHRRWYKTNKILFSHWHLALNDHLSYWKKLCLIYKICYFNKVDRVLTLIYRRSSKCVNMCVCVCLWVWDLQQQLVNYTELMCPSCPSEAAVMLPVIWPAAHDVTSCAGSRMCLCVWGRGPCRDPAAADCLSVPEEFNWHTRTEKKNHQHLYKNLNKGRWMNESQWLFTVWK